MLDFDAGRFACVLQPLTSVMDTRDVMASGVLVLIRLVPVRCHKLCALERSLWLFEAIIIGFEVFRASNIQMLLAFLLGVPSEASHLSVCRPKADQAGQGLQNAAGSPRLSKHELTPLGLFKLCARMSVSSGGCGSAIRPQ